MNTTVSNPFAWQRLLPSLLPSLPIFNDTKTLDDLFEEYKVHINEKSDAFFRKLLEITPSTPTDEAYVKASNDIYALFETEFKKDIYKMSNAAENEYLSPNELEEKLLNMLIPDIVELKRKIDNETKTLWEKALTEEMDDKKIKKFKIADKIMFLESNILGLIIETKDLTIMGELMPYFLILLLRLTKTITENKDISELEEDIKIVAKKIKEAHPTPTAIDDYFLEDLLN